MTFPPSYREATQRSWIQFVAPYLVEPRDLRNLCLVNRQFLATFQPILWARPFQTVRPVRRLSEDDISWWFEFVNRHLPREVSPETRALARVLDTRDITKNPYQFWSIPEDDIHQSFREALKLFPHLSCVLLDRLPGVDPTSLFTESLPVSSETPLRLLSLVNCSMELRATLLTGSFLRDLVCLDVSGSRGDLRHVFRPGQQLPNLRVLKIRSRQLQSETLIGLMYWLRGQLWSLDVTGNDLRDQVIPHIVGAGFGSGDLQFSGHPEVEGRRVFSQPADLRATLEESEWSASFNHPDRYLADPPDYRDLSSDSASRPGRKRNDGISPIRPDSTDALVQKFSARNPYEWTDLLEAPNGLTHLHLSDNKLTSAGISTLFRIGRGQLQCLSCDSVVSNPLLPLTHSWVWPKTAKIHGFLGMAQLLRPCTSANLRELHIHHSIVTQLPTFETDGWPTLARLWFAEKAILPRVELAYPEAFVPDMNPRLTKLSLMRIPRRSCGPLVEKLITFLKLLAIQERDIRERYGSAPPLRGPGILKGLRHLTLEFEPDPLDEHSWTSEDFDAEAILQSGEPGFSFFADEQAHPPAQKHSNNHLAKQAESAVDDDLASEKEDPLANWETYSIPADRGNPARVVQVWTGTQKPNPNPIIDYYRKLVVHHKLRFNAQAATPAQTQAGVPEKSNVYQSAWHATIMPPEVRRPGPTDLEGMVDVLDHIKKHRLNGKAEYERKGFKIAKDDEYLYWTGDLKVSYR